MNDLDLVILKTLISNKKHAIDFVNEADPKLFSTETWNFANIIFNYIKTYKELPTQRVILEKLAKSNNEKLIEHIKKTWNQVESISVNDAEYKHDLEKLKNRFAEKQIANTANLLAKMELGKVDVSKALAEMQKSIQSIKGLSQNKTFERKTLKDAVSSFRKEYNAKMQDATFDAGIKTGYSILDSATGGLRSGELLLIGGESGSGKSLLLMNTAIQMWLQNNTIEQLSNFNPGQNILYFSLEMPFKPCLNRVLARLSENPSKKIRNASLNVEESIRLKKVLKFIQNYPFQFEIIDIPRGATMESLEHLYQDAKIHFDPKIVVIDYLGLMDYDGPEMDDWLKLGKIAEKIHEFSRVHNCIVLSAVQLNRSKGKSEEDRIGLHRVGRSALILQNANIAIQIETRTNESSQVDLVYHLIKNRDGELQKGRLIKNLANGTLIDDNTLEDGDDQFQSRDVDDISSRIESIEL